VSNNIIRIENLSASYGRGAKAVQALREVSVEIKQGEIFGLLGPNGAGKTTLLSCLEGLHKPDQGSVRVNGRYVSKEPQRTKALLGIQLQRTALLDELTVVELVQLYAALYQVYLNTFEIDVLLERFGLVEQRKKLARRLSGGQQQRLALALALANDPQIVLLDEPTGALDPRARRATWEIIRQLHDEGRTIVITTHAMEEAEALCGRVAIIDHGQIVACDTPYQLIANLESHPVLKTNLEVPLQELQGLPNVCGLRYSGQYLEIETTQPQETLAGLHSLATRLGRSVGEVTLRQPNLEDVFLKLTGRELNPTEMSS
jgi:ABC-2 type transport system ATP-binding protein